MNDDDFCMRMAAAAQGREIAALIALHGADEGDAACVEAYARNSVSPMTTGHAWSCLALARRLQMAVESEYWVYE